MVNQTSISEPKHPIESALAKDAIVFCAEFSVSQNPRCATTFVLAHTSDTASELISKLGVISKFKILMMLCCCVDFSVY